MWIRICALLLASCHARTHSIAPPVVEATASLTTQPITRDDLTPPFTLASDGTQLALTRLEARAVVEGPLAFTELHLYFKNTEARVREGTFQITLPQRAAISRFAMEIEGQLVEAEVVPKLIARRAYDDFLHRKQDPALLERGAGNQFTAKVFPIAANADKHLVISYSQELPGSRYSLPLRGLPTIGTVDITLRSATHAQHLRESSWQPDRDFVSTSTTTAAAIGAGDAFAAQIELGTTIGRDVPTSLTVLVDTSASRALGYARYLERIQRLIADIAAHWGAALPISVIAFDQDTQPIYTGGAAGFGEAQRRAMLERGAAGASDLGQALALAKGRVLVITDGVITAGRDDVPVSGIDRVDVALVGGLRDERTAALLTSSKRRGVVLDLETDPVAAALGEAVATDIAIEIPGATWVYPRRVASARAGTKVMVFARGITSPTVDVIANQVTHRLRVQAGTRPLVDRAVAGAELAALEAQLAAEPGNTTLRSTIARISVASRVLSSETSMLVLETDADYQRYGIDRRALADILTVGPSGLAWQHRTAGTLPGASTQPQPAATREPLGETTTEDRDGDAILDAVDRCPGEPEAYNGAEDDDGCPDRGRVVVTDSHIVIMEPIQFRFDQAVLGPATFPILDAVATTLTSNPEIQQLEIAGHTDSLGDAATNLDLSGRRANAVRDYLIAKGVEASRLKAHGYGESQPKDRRDRARNRRVDFLILQRAGSPAPAPTPPPPPPPAVTGELALIQQAIASRDLDAALARARAWHAREPGSVLALIGLGEALEATHAATAAARIYGSIIDLFPARADLRRFAGERLIRVANARELAIDTFRRAVGDRPDHMTGHRLLAYAYVRNQQLAEGFAAILAGLDHTYRATSYTGGRQVLGEDAGLIGAVYANQVPAKRGEIEKALAARKLAIATTPSTRFVLHWETDANDVDLHVRDARGNHAFFSKPALPTGGKLYADVTTGYGPECFTIPGTPSAGPYQLSAHYYAQGPMGYGMGMLEIVRFDGAALAFEHRPFTITTNSAMIALGSY